MVNVSPVVALHGGHNKASVNTLELILEDNSYQLNRGGQGVLERASDGYYLVELAKMSLTRIIQFTVDHFLRAALRLLRTGSFALSAERWSIHRQASIHNAHTRTLAREG